jgi:hypothetical protein
MVMEMQNDSDCPLLFGPAGPGLVKNSDLWRLSAIWGLYGQDIKQHGYSIESPIVRNKFHFKPGQKKQEMGLWFVRANLMRVNNWGIYFNEPEFPVDRKLYWKSNLLDLVVCDHKFSNLFIT